MKVRGVRSESQGGVRRPRPTVVDAEIDDHLLQFKIVGLHFFDRPLRDEEALEVRVLTGTGVRSKSISLTLAPDLPSRDT